jgi:hypothetical protein
MTKADWARAINTWASRSKANLPLKEDPGFLSSYQASDAWSVYTQLIWDFSYLVGCGFSMFEDESLGGKISQLYVCNYGPA